MARCCAFCAFERRQAVRLLRIAAPVLAFTLLAACASTTRAPVVDRPVTRTSSPLFKPPAPPPAPPLFDQRPETYTVKRGDTLYSIAKEKGVDYRELAAWNGLADPSTLKEGTVLRLQPPQAAPQAQPAAQAQADAGVQVQPIVTPG